MQNQKSNIFNTRNIIGWLAISLIVLMAIVMPAEEGDLKTEIKVSKEAGATARRTYRGKECILYELAWKDHSARSFFVNGQLVMSESDEDGDGFFETFTVDDTKSGNFERFTRLKNGSVLPVDSAKLKGIKEKKALADEKLATTLQQVEENSKASKK